MRNKVRKIFKKIYKKNKKVFVFLCLIVLFVLFPMTYTLGRYIYKETRNFYLSSKNFYFNADKLADTMMDYQIDNWSGVTAYPVTIYMNSYKNNSIYADSDITYDISYTCSNGVTCSSDKSSGTIGASTHTDSFTVTLTPTSDFDDGDTAWVEITASATAPYTKTITGKVTLKVGHLGLTYEILDEANRTYFDVNITNTLDTYKVKEAFSTYQVGDEMDYNDYLELDTDSQSKCSSARVSITFDPNVVILDMTTPAALKAVSSNTTTIDGYDYLSTVVFDMEALSSEAVRFYKKNIANDYSYSGNGTPIVNITFS